MREKLKRHRATIAPIREGARCRVSFDLNFNAKIEVIRSAYGALTFDVIPSLRGVVNVYAGGGGGGKDRTEQSETTSAPPPQRDPLLRPLDLNAEERAALVAFLETL